jgi:hypothetical protein
MSDLNHVKPATKTLRETTTKAEQSTLTGILSRHNLIGAAVSAVLGCATVAGCGEPFTSGPDTNTDAGVEGGSTPDGGPGGTGAFAGAGGTGLEGGSASAGNGGEAGAGGTACNGVELTLDNMAEYEYAFREEGCAGPIVATSLENVNFEIGATTVCLPGGKSYVLVAQVKDHSNGNSLRLSLPDDSKIEGSAVTTLAAQEPINEATANLLCNATAGWTDCIDTDQSTGAFVCEGISENDAGVASSNAYIINFNFNN